MKTVLYIDDNQEMIDIVNSYMTSTAYELISESDSGKAIEVCEERNPDLVLMDINMPGMDGFEITRKLRDTGFTNPVIILTAYFAS